MDATKTLSSLLSLLSYSSVLPFSLASLPVSARPFPSPFPPPPSRAGRHLQSPDDGSSLSSATLPLLVTAVLPLLHFTNPNPRTARRRLPLRLLFSLTPRVRCYTSPSLPSVTFPVLIATLGMYSSSPLPLQPIECNQRPSRIHMHASRMTIFSPFTTALIVAPCPESNPESTGL